MVHTRLRVRVRTSRLGYLASAGKRNLPRALRENFRHKNKTTKRKGHCCYDAKGKTGDLEKIFMNRATAHVFKQHRASSGSYRAFVLDTRAWQSTRALPFGARVFAAQHDPLEHGLMVLSRPKCVSDLVLAEAISREGTPQNPLDVDVLDFCRTWGTDKAVVYSRFKQGLYVPGTVVRLTVATRTSLPGPRINWINEIVGDVTRWAVEHGLGVTFVPVSQWGPEAARWSIAHTRSLVYEYGRMYNMIFVVRKE